jgi:hypothetical protein
MIPPWAIDGLSLIQVSIIVQYVGYVADTDEMHHFISARVTTHE